MLTICYIFYVESSANGNEYLRITNGFNKPVRSFRIVFSAHAILSRISHLLLFNQEQKKVKTKEGEKFGIKSHAH